MDQWNLSSDQIFYNSEADEKDIRMFMKMMGFQFHKFQFNCEQSPYLNFYIKEYLNDTVIKEFDYIQKIKKKALGFLYERALRQLKPGQTTLRIYAIEKESNTVQLNFSTGEVGLKTKLQINQQFDYSWELAKFADQLGPKIVFNTRIPLLYYASPVEKKIDETTISAFCEVSNILDHKHLLQHKGIIKHYFEIGMELVEKI